MRRGTSLVELLVVTVLLGALVAIGVPGAAHVRDRARVRGAAADVASAFSLARAAALHRAERTAVRFDTSHARVLVHRGADTLFDRALSSVHGVTLSATRDSMAYASDGLGYGAANLAVVVRRGSAADTVVVSRLGRVRW
jgi:Tfp pilus assembly protein FimT